MFSSKVLNEIYTTPDTIKGNKNYLKSYVNRQGFDYDSNCLEVYFGKNGKNLSNYVKKIGEYNTVKASNPRWRKPTTVKYRDYAQYCPEGWNERSGGCYAPDSYNGPCNAGRWKTGRACANRFLWWGRYCYNYRYWQQPSYFYGYDANAKKGWANSCRANWPEKSANLPGKWICNYGQSLAEDVAFKKVKYLGTANSYLEAAKLVLLQNIRGASYFIMVDNFVYVAADGGPSDFTNKGSYENNCTENGNKKAILYELTSDLFTLIEKCKKVNNSLNTANNTTNRLAQSNFDIYKAKVDELKKSNPEWETENKKEKYNSATKTIQNNLNQIVSNLSENYNKKTELYNLQANLLNRQNAATERHQKKLNQQLDTMNQIQDEIAVKERVAELNNEMVKKQVTNKKLLIGFFVLLPFLVIPLLITVSGAASPLVGLGIGGLMILGYIIYAIVIINKNKIKKFVKPTMKQLSKYEKAVKKFYEKEKGKLSDSLSEYVYGQCNCPPEEDEESSGPSMHFKGLYVMESNGPFYYYDGSAPPQQVMPQPDGSIEFDLNGLLLKWPKEISDNINLVNKKNPVMGYFFTLWLSILQSKGISVDDPRFAKTLNVIDFETSNSTPPPYWQHIKLPMVTNLQQNVSYICQSYNSMRKKTGQDAGTFLVNMWDYVYGNKIPTNIYQTWLTKINTAITNKEDIALVYKEFFNYIVSLPEFATKYGSLSQFWDKKVENFIKVINSDVALSAPSVIKFF